MENKALLAHAMRFGAAKTIENVDRKFGSKPYYHLVVVKRKGVVRRWLLTDSEIKKIEERADKNPEDWLGVKLPWWQWILMRLRLL
jgi:hypothetical protein